MQNNKTGSDKDLGGDLVIEILPCLFVGALFAWIASKALARFYVSQMIIAKGFFGVLFLGFSLGTLAMSYIVLIAVVEFIKDAVRKEP